MKFTEFAFLADENIHPEVVGFLRDRGLGVATLADLGLRGSSDLAVLEAGFNLDRVVLTHDSDSGSLAVAEGRPVRGLIYLRPGHIQAEFTIQTLRTLIESDVAFEPPFLAVAVRGADKVRVRVRSL